MKPRFGIFVCLLLFFFCFFLQRLQGQFMGFLFHILPLNMYNDLLFNFYIVNLLLKKNKRLILF